MSNVGIRQKTGKRQRRAYRVRSKITGTPARPRLSVRISNRNVSAQLIDDSAGKTIVAVTTVGKKSLNGSLSAKAEWAGIEIAKKAAAKKVKSIVLDRGAKLYHGRIKAFSDAARKGGLEF